MNSDSDPHWSHSALPKIVNILAYIFFTGTHAYFVWNGTYDDGASKLTYITPASWVSLIWPVIHLLLLGTIIYQFTENGRRIVVEGISWRFLVVMEVTALHLYLWHIHEYVLAFLVAIVNSFLVSDIHEILDEIQLQYTTPIPASIFVYIPFSLYYAWTSVLIFLSGFAAFGVDAATQPAGTYTKICVFLTLFYLQSSTAGGLYGWLAIVWYLWGVFVYQRSSGFVHESALVFAVLASVWVGEALIDGIVSYWWPGRGERGGVVDEESTPLLG